MGPIHVRPIPPTLGVDSWKRGMLIGCQFVTDAGSIRMRRYEFDSPEEARVDLMNVMISLEDGVYETEGR